MTLENTIVPEKNQIISKGNCRVCGDSLVGQIITCSSCDTPTHAACHSYTLGCPIYGCKEMSKPLHDGLVGISPQEQCEVHQSLLQNIKNKMLSLPLSIYRKLFPRQEYLPFPVLIHSQQLALTKEFLDNGAYRNQSDWWKRQGSETIPNTKKIYAMYRWVYNHPKDQRADQFLQLFRKERDRWSWHHTGTKINYCTGLEAVVSELQIDRTIKQIQVEIPEFTKCNQYWSYLVLAKKQPKKMHGNNEPIPINAHAFLDAVFGEGYEEAGAVFQSISLRRNGLLREVRLWVPTAAYRNTERAVVFGLNDDDEIHINANGNVGYAWAARGVVSVVALKSPAETIVEKKLRSSETK